VIAPIAGGWISSNPSLGWRWTQWITLIISAFAWLVAFFALPESYLPVLLDWKAKQLRHITGNDRYQARHANEASFFKRLGEVLPLPIKFFGQEPVIAVFGAYLVLLYALLFSFLSGFEYIFQRTYQLSTGMTGSCFGAIAAGATFGIFAAPGLYSWARNETNHVHGAPVDPEFRLWPAIVAGPLLPACLFCLGWGTRPYISIWLGLVACFGFGLVLISVYSSVYEYVIDSYGDHAAVALSSITLVRYFVAGGMVLAARPMYEGIGVSGTLTLMGSLAAVLAPAPFLFYKFGKKLRGKSPYAKGREYT
jgi:MFS transporter, DHA1 family, multidrug resistance protein